MINVANFSQIVTSSTVADTYAVTTGGTASTGQQTSSNYDFTAELKQQQSVESSKQPQTADKKSTPKSSKEEVDSATDEDEQDQPRENTADNMLEELATATLPSTAVYLTVAPNVDLNTSVTIPDTPQPVIETDSTPVADPSPAPVSSLMNGMVQTALMTNTAVNAEAAAEQTPTLESEDVPMPESKVPAQSQTTEANSNTISTVSVQSQAVRPQTTTPVITVTANAINTPATAGQAENTTALPQNADALKQQLSQDTGVTINSLTLSTPATETAAASDNKTTTTTATDSDNLLKQLDVSSRHVNQRITANQARNGQGNNTGSEGEAGNFSNNSGNGTATAFTIQTTATATTGKKASTVETHAVNDLTNLQNLNSDNSLTNSLNQLHTAATATGANLAAAARVDSVEQIMDRVRDFLPMNVAAAETSVKLEVETSSAGRVQIQLQQKGESLEVTISAGSEAGRQELSDRREEMSQMLRNLGYKELAVNIADRQNQGGYQQYQQQSETQQNRSNASAENVRLAGNDRQDLLQLLTRV